MSATITPTPTDVYTALVAFIQTVLGSTVPVVQGINNRTPMPVGGFVLLTAISQSRLAWNYDSWGSVNPAVLSSEMDTMIDVQIDCYGPSSAAWAATLVTLLRDSYACEQLQPNVQPLYADDARMIPLIDAEQQYEQRWMIHGIFQYNPVVTVPQQFAEALDATLYNVDEEFPA